jgi:hypothetical protein
LGITTWDMIWLGLFWPSCRGLKVVVAEVTPRIWGWAMVELLPRNFLTNFWCELVCPMGANSSAPMGSPSALAV